MEVVHIQDVFIPLCSENSHSPYEGCIWQQRGEGFEFGLPIRGLVRKSIATVWWNMEYIGSTLSDLQCHWTWRIGNGSYYGTAKTMMEAIEQAEGYLGIAKDY